MRRGDCLRGWKQITNKEQYTMGTIFRKIIFDQGKGSGEREAIRTKTKKRNNVVILINAEDKDELFQSTHP